MGIDMNLDYFIRNFMVQTYYSTKEIIFSIDATSFLYTKQTKIWINSKKSKIIADKIYNKFEFMWERVKYLIVCFDGDRPLLKNKTANNEEWFKTSDCMIFKNLKKKLTSNNFNIKMFLTKCSDYGEGELKCKYFYKFSSIKNFKEKPLVFYSNDNDIFIQSIKSPYKKLTILKFFGKNPKFLQFRMPYKHFCEWKLILLFSILGNDYVPRLSDLNTRTTLNKIENFCTENLNYMYERKKFNKNELSNFIEKFFEFMSKIELEKYTKFENFLLSNLNTTENQNNNFTNNIDERIVAFYTYLNLHKKRRKKNPVAQKYNLENNIKNRNYNPQDYTILKMFLTFWVRSVWYLRYCTSDIGLEKNNKFNQFECVDIKMPAKNLIEFPWFLCSAENIKIMISELFIYLDRIIDLD